MNKYFWAMVGMASIISINCFAAGYDPTAIHDRGKQKIIGDLHVTGSLRAGSIDSDIVQSKNINAGDGKISAEGGNFHVISAEQIDTTNLYAKIIKPKKIILPTVYHEVTIKIENQTMYTPDGDSKEQLTSTLKEWLGLVGSAGVQLVSGLPTHDGYSTINFSIRADYSCDYISEKNPGFGPNATFSCDERYVSDGGGAWCNACGDDGAFAVLGNASGGLIQCSVFSPAGGVCYYNYKKYSFDTN